MRLPLLLIALAALSAAEPGRDESGFERDQSLAKAAERVLEFVRTHPMTSTRRLSEELGIKDRVVRVALERLVEDGVVERGSPSGRQAGRGSAWVAVGADGTKPFEQGDMFPLEDEDDGGGRF